MKVDFRDLFPALQAPLEQLGQVGWIRDLNQTAWLFAIIETSHLLFLVVLGGAVLVLNLRILGAVLRDVPVQQVEQSTRPWLWAGIIGTSVSGTYMAIATAVTLLPSAAFFVKIVALIAAIVLSVAMSRQVRGGEQGARSSGALAGAAIVLWLAALLLFAGTAGLASGSSLVAIAGLGLFAGFLDRYRRHYVSGLTIVAIAALALTLAGNAESGRIALVASLVLVVVTGALERRGAEQPVFSGQRVAALSSALAWITVAAAGRWIGFS